MDRFCIFFIYVEKISAKQTRIRKHPYNTWYMDFLLPRPHLPHLVSRTPASTMIIHNPPRRVRSFSPSTASGYADGGPPGESGGETQNAGTGMLPTSPFFPLLYGREHPERTVPIFHSAGPRNAVGRGRKAPAPSPAPAGPNREIIMFALTIPLLQVNHAAALQGGSRNMLMGALVMRFQAQLLPYM